MDGSPQHTCPLEVRNIHFESLGETKVNKLRSKEYKYISAYLNCYIIE